MQDDGTISPAALVAFFRTHRDELLDRWERAMRSLPNEADLPRQDLIDDLPTLLDHTVATTATLLEGGQPPPRPPLSSKVHGHHRLRAGVELWEVLAEMSLLRECIVELWREHLGEPPAAPLLALQIAIDQAASASIQSYVEERDRTQSRLERESAERATSLRRIETLVSSHPDFFYLLDREHRFVYVSPSLLRLWGISADEAHGRTFEELGYPPELVKLHDRQIDEAFEGSVVRDTNPYTDPLGQTREYEYIFVPIRSEDGSIDAIAGVTRDVSEQKQHQTLLEEAATSAEHLIAMLGHDLRTPLGAVSASAQTLLLARDLPEHHARTLERIQRSAGRMARLVSDIVDWTRSRLAGGIPIERHRIDLVEVAEQVVAELRTLHPDRAIELETEQDLVGWWDPDRMAQVVQNLLNNAIVHGAADQPVQLGIHSYDDQAVIEVRNAGDPIPAALLPKIFDPFASEGTGVAGPGRLGLGLYIVDAIVTGHGGSVEVTSSAQEGTTFTVRLPRHPSATDSRVHDISPAAQ